MDIVAQYNRFLPQDPIVRKTIRKKEGTSGKVIGNYSSGKSPLIIYWMSGSGFIVSGRIPTIRSRYIIRDEELLRRFLKYHPNFKTIIDNVYKGLINNFDITSKPVIRVDSDPEYGGDLVLDIYFDVKKKTERTIELLFEFRRAYKKPLTIKERLLLRINIK